MVSVGRRRNALSLSCQLGAPTMRMPPSALNLNTDHLGRLSGEIFTSYLRSTCLSNKGLTSHFTDLTLLIHTLIIAYKHSELSYNAAVYQATAGARKIKTFKIS